MHYMQTATDSGPEGPSPEDARVHCVVLKIRTEPCVENLHPEVLDSRPFEVSALSKAAASSGPNSVLTQPEILRTLVRRTHRGELPTGRAFANQLSE